ncbi:AMP-binding protein [Dermatobacter hominis]|uniref:AMP-binding protein n=1 Tax=Dermatobacter hominis TaxID=2884263 RepID=UPI001D11AC1F|nr:AMP-binding protein [Dermatobacter hominis]UDY34773.1 AMP-binding protein [Dermatobacter hominis]
MKVPLTVRDHIERAELVYGRRVGVVDEPDQPAPPLLAPDGGPLTYAALADRSRALAAGLESLGVPQGGRVAMVSQNSARLLTLLYGAPASGRIAVPVNFRLSPAEVSYIVEHSGADVLLVDPELEEALAEVTAPKRFTIGAETDELLYRHDLEAAPWEPDEDATATINYTSGTTARPKGVEMTHRNLWVNAATFGWQAGVSDRDVYLHTLPMFHCNGWGMPFATAGMGVRQVVLRKVDGTEILRRVAEHGVTLMCGAPAVVAMTLEAAASWEGETPGRDRVRIVVAGAPPPTAIIERVETELGWEFIQIYGLTETAPLLTMNRAREEWDDLTPGERAKKLSRAGAPALGIRLRTDDEGELLARGNVILKSYWEQPDATAEALEGGWFHTGDGAVIDEDRYVTIVDRKKDVIISGGENVSSIEVEDALFSHPAVTEAAVIGIPSERWGETVTALVVLDPSSDLAAADGDEVEQALIAHCRDRLAHYKCPTSVEVRDALERTATGKLQKYKLRAPYWEGRERQVN